MASKCAVRKKVHVAIVLVTFDVFYRCIYKSTYTWIFYVMIVNPPQRFFSLLFFCITLQMNAHLAFKMTVMSSMPLISNNTWLFQSMYNIPAIILQNMI